MVLLIIQIYLSLFFLFLFKNRHSGSHETQPRMDFDFEESCHSAPVMSRTIWQKASDGSMKVGSHSSDSSGVASSLQEHSFHSISEDENSQSYRTEIENHFDIPEVKAKEDGGSDGRDVETAYEDTSHPVVSLVSKGTSFWCLERKPPA